ncbi:MAG: ArsC/Spx/MgsR family protein [Bacteroidota bacterium]
MAITIYHNPRCKKSRAGLHALEKLTNEFEIKLYLKENPLTEEDLAQILQKLNKKPEEIIRKQEDVFKSNYKGKHFTDKEWIKILVENPKLIQRPVVIKDQKAVIADPINNLQNLF